MNKRKQIIEVVPYDNNWPKQFAQESQCVRNIFSEIFIEIHHIGSTAVDGLAAKPVIDMILVVADLHKVDQYNVLMGKLGYEAWGEYGILGRRFFVKGEAKRTHHIHTFEQGSEHIVRHIAVRNYLQKNPKVAEEYAALKIKLAKHYKDNRRAYVIGKQDYVKILEQKAIVWFNKLNEEIKK